jgi:tRNA A37 methylthiotransferase MiaB
MDNRFDSVGIFQYHDEPLAASSKLPNKVDESIAKNRINELNTILDSIYTEKKEARKKSEQVGYIMDIPLLQTSNPANQQKVIIRPELHAPEVDEYDEVALEHIETTGDLDIGTYVMYTL